VTFLRHTVDCRAVHKSERAVIIETVGSQN